MNINTRKAGDRHAGAHQRGATLLVAVVLLLLAGVMTLAALNVGLFETRSTANDLRAKLVNEAAETGLAQGFEYLMRQHDELLTAAQKAAWEKCSATDTKFPCGAVSDDLVDADGDPATSGTVARRATLYRLKAVAKSFGSIPAELSQHMLPLESGYRVTAAGNGEPVDYGVAPLLCIPMKAHEDEAADAPIRCGSFEDAQASEQKAVTFVSVAMIPGEAARTTLVQTLGQYPLLPSLVNAPPVVASGAIDIAGALQVVTNPHGTLCEPACEGSALSIWSRRNAVKTGTANTCHINTFFYSSENRDKVTEYEGTLRCDDCSCDAGSGDPALLSYDSSGGLQTEGQDVLDVEGTSADRGTGENHNVRSDSLSYPTCEFPPDLFRYIFGVQAWTDENNDCFAETKAFTAFKSPQTSTTVQMGKDEAYLYKNASSIIVDTTRNYPEPGGPSASTMTKPGQIAATLTAAAAGGGIVWCQTGCDISAAMTLGSPSKPVVLVLDRPPGDGGTISIHGVVFGLVFIRDTGSVLFPSSASSSSTNGCQPNCAVQMNAGATIYGALVLQGQMKVNGTSTVIYDKTVLSGFGGPANSVPATLPGAWTDQFTY